MDHLVTTIGTALALVIGVALAATLVSKNAQTAQVITSAGNAFGHIIGAATAPVSGGFTSY